MTFEQPNVIPISDRNYRLMEDYTAGIVNKAGNRILITVPKGYVTDLASIPRFIWSLFGLTPDGLYRGAAVVHDYIYSKHIKGASYSLLPDGMRLTRAECDEIFKILIHASGEAHWKEEAMYRAVRTFGWAYY